ncbi:MAG: thioredoxin [Pyrinomonadaceae bacterium]|nr:thioredoxin [Pyrinomonadaceae bacterium]
MIVTCPKCSAKNRVDESAAAVSQPVCGRCGAMLKTDAWSGADGSGVSTPLVITDASFTRDVMQAGARPVLLDCWAEWCGPCRMIGPIIDQLAAESAGRYITAKLNVDENPRTAAQLGIQSIPALLIFKNGELVDRMIGAQPKQAIVARLAAHS